MAVPGERLVAGTGATARAGGTISSLASGSDDILGWLDILLKGKPDQQAAARTEIAMILEARGFPEDAEEAYWTNVQQGAADRRSYERLIALYQLRRDRLSETLVRRKLEEVFNKPASASPVASYEVQGAATPRSAPPAHQPNNAPVSRVNQANNAPVSLANQPNSAPVSLARQLTAPESPHRPPARCAASGTPLAPQNRPPRPDHWCQAEDRPHRPRTARIRLPSAPLRAAGSRAVQVSDLVPPAPIPGLASQRRRVGLLPNPTPSSRRYRTASGGLIALQPTTIAAFLLASFGVAALIAFLLIASDRGNSAKSGAAGVGQASARCADGSIRFPGANDPRGAVASAYRQHGVDVEAGRPGNPRLTVDQAEQVIGGWIGASLMLEHAGQPAPKLNEWLDAESPRPTLANAIMAGRHLDTMLTPEEWTEIRSWPASTCEGAFVHDPRNAALIRLVERVVAR